MSEGSRRLEGRDAFRFRLTAATVWTYDNCIPVCRVVMGISHTIVSPVNELRRAKQQQQFEYNCDCSVWLSAVIIDKTPCTVGLRSLANRTETCRRSSQGTTQMTH